VSPWRRWTSLGTPTHQLLLQADGLWHAGHARTPLRRSRWHESFEAWCAGHPDSQCDLLASGTIVHDLVCAPDLPMRSDEQLLGHARAVFRHFHGDPAAAWRMACWFSGRSCGVSALHGIDFEALKAGAGRHGVRLRRVQPWWSRVLAHAEHRIRALRRTPSAWLLVVEGRFVTALWLCHGQLRAIRSHWLGEAGPFRLARLGAQLQALSADGPAAAVLLAAGHGLDGEAASDIQVLGHLEESEPAVQWMLPPRGRP
jgi:hypothetical protein